MQRRDFMRAVLAATVAPSAVLAQTPVGNQTPAPTPLHEGPPAPGPVPWMQGLDSTRLDHPAILSLEDFAQPDLGFFHPDQMATLSHLCDLLMPPMNGNPGAKEAGVPEFLDFYVSESSSQVKTMYQEGLDKLNADSQQQFHLPFSQVSASQADNLLRPLLSTWMPDHYPGGGLERFINAAHHDIRQATTNSHAWAEAAAKRRQAAHMEMYWSPVEPDVYGERAVLIDRAMLNNMKTNQSAAN